jgi:hypothetical protein
MEGMAVADEQKVHCNSGSVAFSILESVAWMHQRESLLDAVEKLEQAAVHATSDEERNCYTIATILCAHAASEAFLNEWAKTHAPSTYEKIAGTPFSLLRTAEELIPKIGGSLSADLIELANVKNALCDPPPALTQAKVNGDWYPGAQRAAAVAKALHFQCFPEPGNS